MTLLDEIKSKCSPEFYALASRPDPVSELDVRRAVWADDGSYLA